MKKKGKHSKNATITTNDPKRPTSKVYMSGKVEKVLEWEPRRIVLTGMVGSEVEGGAKLSAPNEAVQVEVVGVESTKGKISVDSVKETESGREWLVRMRCEAQDSTRSIRDSMDITVRINGERTLVIPMSVTAKFRELIDVSPRNTVTFNKRETKKLLQGSSISKEVTVKSSDPSVAFRVTNVELVDLPEGLFEAHVAEVKAGSEYQVQITLNEYVERRYVRGKVRITTDHPKFPSKDLRVFARFEDRRPVEKGL